MGELPELGAEDVSLMLAWNVITLQQWMRSRVSYDEAVVELCAHDVGWGEMRWLMGNANTLDRSNCLMASGLVDAHGPAVAPFSRSRG